MNLEEAKLILLRYRPEVAADADSETAEALELARRDPALSQWFKAHQIRQSAVRATLRGIAIPEGLKEQIVSEQIARERRTSWRRTVIGSAIALIVLIAVVIPLLPRTPSDNRFSVYESRMVGNAQRGYAMDLVTQDVGAVRSYLAQKGAPSNYVLPRNLQQAEVVGCAVQSWNGNPVSMICFRTGKALPPGQKSDLWLFVVDRSAVPGAPEESSARLEAIKGMMTAVWSQGGRLYLLGTEGDAQAIARYL